jgi:xylan 1,4-beta-xylosidase
METESDEPSVEAMAVQQAKGKRSLLLINKSAKSAQVSIQGMPDASKLDNLQMFSLDANGVKSDTPARATLAQEPLNMNPYSLVLLRFSVAG